MLPKRLFDLIVGFVALLACVPVFLIIALAIKLDSRGPAFYRARRIGQAGRPFQMYKFRTMLVGADRAGPALADRNDQRLTRVGRWLRCVRLHELPQLLNVLRGEMSLVGPRPEAPEYVRPGQPIWREVLSVRPGMCGVAQLDFAVDEVALLNNQSAVDQNYRLRILPVKLQLELNYIHRQSLLVDLTLLAQTCLLMMHERRHAPSI